MLEVRPLTPVRPIQKNGDLEDALETVVADHTRDRGQLIGLTAATKQKNQDQAVLDEQCEESARREAKAIEEAAKETVKIKQPFWKGLF